MQHRRDRSAKIGDRTHGANLRRVVTVDYHRCEDLLRTGSVAYVALAAPDGPHVYPVSYRYHDHGVVFRTSTHSILGRLAIGQPAAVQVTDLDATSRSGWSVLVRGRSQMITDPAQLVALWSADELQPWVDGYRAVFIKIPATQLSGRDFVDHDASHHDRPDVHTTARGKPHDED